MTGFIGQHDIGTDTQTVALIDIDDYGARVVAVMRNEGKFKLAVAVILTRADGVTPESKTKFRLISSQFRLIGHFPQVTKFVLES
jgi:hypothetical protein